MFRGFCLAQQFAYFQPELVSHIAVIPVPFIYVTAEEKRDCGRDGEVLPNFKYQLSYIDPAKFEDGRVRARKDVERVFRAFLQPKPLVPRPKGQL